MTCVLQCSKPQVRHKQLTASSDEEPQPQVTPWKDKEKPVLALWAAISHGLHLASSPAPGPKTAPEPQFQTWRHTAYKPSRQNEHCHVDVTIGKHIYITLNWEEKKKRKKSLACRNSRTVFPIYPEKAQSYVSQEFPEDTTEGSDLH